MAPFPPFDLSADMLAPVYLIVAAASLVVAIRYLRRVVAPIGELLHLLAAAVVGVLTVSTALVLVLAAILMTAGR